MDSARAGEALPPPNDEIGIDRVDLDAAALATDLFGGDQRAAGPEKRIQNQLPTRRTVHHGIRQHGDRLDGRMQLQMMKILPGIASEPIGRGVVPDVAAVAAVTTQVNVVAVTTAPVLEDENQLMLAPVEAAHSGGVLGPDAQVLVFGEAADAGRQGFRKM